MVNKVRRKLGKKGNVEDVITSIGWLFTIVLVVLIGGIIIAAFDTKIQSDGTEAAKAFMTKYNARWIAGWDYGILFLLLGFIVFSVMAARFIPSDPIYMTAAFIMIVMIVLMAGIFGNIYDEMTLKNSDISTEESKYVFIPFIMDYLLEISIIYFAIVAYVLYSRRGQEVT